MMLANYGRSTLPMLAGLGGTAEIARMQQSLVNLAQATGHPEFVPGRVDGVLDDNTMVAIAAAMSVVANELDGWLSTAIQLALVGGASTSTAKSYISQYAPQLSVAFNAAAIKYKQTPTAPVPVPTTAIAVPWYTTWWGIGGIIIGGVIVLKFVLGPRQAAQ